MKNEIINKIHDIVIARMGDIDKHFINMMIFNKLSQMSTHMHMNIEYYDGTIVPCNFYGLSLAPSGYNKGRLNSTLEGNVFKDFRKSYNDLSSDIASDNVNMLAERQASKEGIEFEEALDLLQKRWSRLPEKLYDFSDATDPGLKGAREKYTLASIGSTCMEIDEIAYNMEKFSEVLSTFLEIYDLGASKDKLIKVDSNSAAGSIPATLFMFGSPSSLLNGSKEEEALIKMLRQGYARRMFFSYIRDYSERPSETPEDILNRVGKAMDGENELLPYFESFATRQYHNKVITANNDFYVRLLSYKQECEDKAKTFKEHQDIEKFELSHRYWKVLKLSGLLAIARKSDIATIDDLEDAIGFAEESGVNFEDIMNRDPNYVRLFNFMIDMGRKLTEADLYEHLHFYSASNQGQRRDMRNLAMAHAHGENGFIRETIRNGVSFYEAEKMKETDLNKMIISHSTDITSGYKNEYASFDNLKKFVKMDGLHFCVHHLKDGYRKSENVIPGFNLLVLDVDNGLPIDMARALLDEYTNIIYTTKRHSAHLHRYRIVIPLKNTVKLQAEDYKKFMENVFEWLPFDVDAQTKDIGRKWLTNNGEVYSNQGVLLDPNDFIPDTIPQKEKRKQLDDLSNLDGVEKYFISKIDEGVGRNNTLIKYALMLLDGGMSYEQIEDKVLTLNDKLANQLSVAEIMKTVMVTVRARIGEQHD